MGILEAEFQICVYEALRKFTTKQNNCYIFGGLWELYIGNQAWNNQTNLC